MGKSRERKRQKTRPRSARSPQELPPSQRGTEIYLDREFRAVIARNLPGLPRMSEIVSHLAEPTTIRLAGFCEGRRALELSIRLTVFAWNATFMWSWTRWFAMVSQAYRVMPHNPKSAYVVLQDVYKIVSEGKRRHYPDVKRRIVDVKFYNYSHNTVDFDVLHRSIDNSDDRMLESIV